MAKEFEQSVYVQPGTKSDSNEPKMGAMGQSVIDFGEQRFGVGVVGEEDRTYAEPGSEGKIAVALMKGNGGISASGSYPEGTSDGITGA